MRSDWLRDEAMSHVLAALMPQNRLIMEVCLSTGLRLGDVLNLRTVALKPRQTVRELKTGKSRRIRWGAELYDKMVANAGKVWVFEGRTDYRRHRTRQAVWKDLKRAADLFRAPGVVPRGAQISPHSARKGYAVRRYHETGGDLDRVQRELNHSSPEVTLLYALADTVRRNGGGK